MAPPAVKLELGVAVMAPVLADDRLDRPLDDQVAADAAQRRAAALDAAGAVDEGPGVGTQQAEVDSARL